ncbi:GDP-mannose dehydrogenase [candidate division KSB3 bacterium]|uniref:UDP-glucose 6-dehydrogenase n=1 Tax=candidate division KSB3 bacterium TaxID=2044937 RepID=A0A2G6KCJ7_9BACT|nr:MAG: GDP-mannose dehydrogenase [candidate division KSB3 bacterium]
MKVSVFGLGYVGCISAACLAREGHNVIGVDPNEVKVEMINAGKSPIVEKDIDDILYDVVKQGGGKGTLTATTDAIRAVTDTDVSLICVGTPSNTNGSLNLEYVKRCSREIGTGLKQKDSYHVVIARSTMLPGSVEEIIREVEYASGKKAGPDFGAVMNPEFLREGSSVEDFYNPAVTVIGQLDEQSGDTVEEMYAFLETPFVRTDIRTAEMMKYANNSFHGLKVAFANEIGAICKALKIDSHQVMKIFCMDDRLNISSYYLRPGFAFGGSCLPKDLRAIHYEARAADVDVPVLRATLESNKTHLERAIQRIIHSGMKKIGILGLSFKPGTDDLRESPMVTLIETLIGKGFDIKIYDKNVSLARLVGANKEFIEKEIPHISSLMADELQAVVSHAEVLIIGHRASEFADVLQQNDLAEKMIYDLARVTDDILNVPSGYEGICW